MGLQFKTVVTHHLVSVFLSFNIPLQISHGCIVGFSWLWLLGSKVTANFLVHLQVEVAKICISASPCLSLRLVKLMILKVHIFNSSRSKVDYGDPDDDLCSIYVYDIALELALH